MTLQEQDKLTIGDKIKIQGWVMMKGMDNNKTYTLIRKDAYSYTFRKGYNGKLVRHYKEDIHLWISEQKGVARNENHIIKL